MNLADGTPVPEKYRLIPLTKGKFAKVSSERYEHLMQWKWQARWESHTQGFYAQRKDSVTRRSVSMHREILGLEYGNKRHGDHIDGDTLNNTDENLRIVTLSQNNRNCGKRKTNKSGYKGVYYDPECHCYRAQIRVDRKAICLGRRDTAEAAWKELYVPAVDKYHGDHGRTS